MANTISTSTNALATAYPPAQLVAMSASGDALVIWFDGTNVKWSYASSPYSSWTTATLLSSIGGGPRWQAGLYKLSNDNALLVVGNSSANIVSYLFTYSSGSHNWSVGSAVSVEASASDFNGGSVPMAADAQGRIWVAWSNNSHVVQIYYTTDNGSTWNSSTTFTQVGGGDDVCIGLAYIGNYIVTTFCGASAVWKYARVDAHSTSIGSWSSATTIPNNSMDNTTLNACLRGAPGSNYGILISDFGNIPTQNYNSNTDTWSTSTNIGSASDQQPTLVTDGTDLYALWSKFSASNNFSLVYKKWVASTQTWDSSSTQLEASGTNITRANGGYGNSTLGFVYTVGTGSPWNVNFDTKSFSVGTQVQKDLSARFRLRSANQLKDLASRFRLRSANQLKDLTTRFRLRSANQLKDLATRFRLRSANQLKDLASRFRLRSANQLKDVATRFRLRSASQLKDLATRFRLRSPDQKKDLTARFRLMSAAQLKDLSTRLRLRSTNQLKDLSSRFRLRSASQLKDLAARLRLRSANQLKDLSTRLRVRSANQLRDISTRLRLRSANVLKDLSCRLVLSVGQASTKDLACRFWLKSSGPPLNGTLIVPSGQSFLIVPSGQDSLIVPSGQGTLIVRP